MFLSSCIYPSEQRIYMSHTVRSKLHFNFKSRYFYYLAVSEV